MWQTKISYKDQLLVVQEWRENVFEVVMSEEAWKALTEVKSPQGTKGTENQPQDKEGLFDAFIRLYGEEAYLTEKDGVSYRSLLVPSNDPFGMKLKSVKACYPLSLETIAQDIFAGHVDDFTFYGWELRKGKVTEDINKAIRKGKDPRNSGAKLENEISMAALYLKDVLKKVRNAPSGNSK